MMSKIIKKSDALGEKVGDWRELSDKRDFFSFVVYAVPDGTEYTVT